MQANKNKSLVILLHFYFISTQCFENKIDSYIYIYVHSSEVFVLIYNVNYVFINLYASWRSINVSTEFSYLNKLNLKCFENMYRIYCDHNASLELVIERNIL
jgi:hypothetical protein